MIESNLLMLRASFIGCSAMSLAAASFAAPQVAQLPNSMRHPEATVSSTLPASDSEPVHIAISLKLRDAAGLQTFADQVSDPHSPFYHHFISPTQVGQLFGPAQSDIDSTVAFLKENGFKVTDVSKNGFVVQADGTVAQASQAFHTQIGYVPATDSSGMVRTNLAPLSMPEGLATQVLSVDGIDSSIQHKHQATTTLLTPTSFKGGYNAGASYVAGFYGQGVNIAIANWDGYRLNNVPLWTSKYFLPTPQAGSGTNIHVVPVGTGATYGAGSAEGEGDLDIQSVLMAAPLSNVYVYDDVAGDQSAPVSTYSKISSDNVADIVTESYGWETSSNNTYFGSTFTSAHNLHLSMTAQGMTYLTASGDNGTAAFPASGNRFGYPDIDPEVLVVGGSILTVDSTTTGRVSEASWGLSGGDGGTGGFDPYDTVAHGFAFNVAPQYQKTLLPSATKYWNYRLCPDIAGSSGGQNGLGSNSGTGWALAIFYNSGTRFPLGSMIVLDGTSIASPACAGAIGALLGRCNTGLTPNATRSNVRFGRMQDYMYNLWHNGSVLFDITQGSSIGNLPGTTTPATPAVGWDFATGLGSLNYGGLYKYIQLAGTRP